MTTQLNEKLSLLLDDQLPEFVRDNYDVFKGFLEEYYKFTEQSTEVQYNIQKAKSFADIDETSNVFVDYFLNQYAYNLPLSVFKDQLNQVDGLVSNTLESKRAIAKRLTEYHGSKGSEGAIRLLFRLLFDEEITFYYPKEDMFRPSDANWGLVKTIFLYSPNNHIDISTYGGGIVEGVTSGASVILDSVFSLKYPYTGDIILYEMKVENYSITGNFSLGENVILKVGNIDSGNIDTVATLKFYNAISSFDIIDSGSGYNKDTLVYLDSPVTEKFIGSVESVGKIGQIKKIKLNSSINLENEYNAASNINIIINQSFDSFAGKFESSGNIASIVLSESGNSIKHGLSDGDLINVEFTSGLVIPEDTYTVNSILSSKRFTIANSAISSGETGNIVLYGRSANIVPVLGAISNYSGQFLDKNSHLSDIKKIQDSDYYQDNSYVIRANQSSALWKDIIKKSVHPAGLKLISEIFITLANAFTATSVIPAGAYNTTLLRLQITNPISADIPTRSLSQLIIESIHRVNRDVFKYRSTAFYYKHFDKFKFYNKSLHLNNFDYANLTIDTDPMYLLDPQMTLSSDVFQGGANVILNSNFTSGGNWTVGSGFAITNSNLSAVGASSNTWQNFVAEGNNKYMVNYEIPSLSAGAITVSLNDSTGTTRTTSGRFSEIFWVNTNTGNIIISGSSFTGNVSNVYVKKLESLIG